VGPFGVDGGGLIDEEVVATEAGVAFAAVGVEDPERRPLPRRAVAIAGDERLGPLPDDVASEPDPGPPGKLETDAGRFGDGGREPTGQARRFEHDEQRLRPPGEGRQPAQPIGDPGRAVRAGQPAAGQVQHEQVHRPTGQQRATDGQPLVERLGRDDHEPFQPDATGDRLDRVEAAREIEPGDDRARDLGFRGEPEDERRPAARAVATDRDAGRPGQAAGPQDRIERGETGGDDAVVRVEPGLWNECRGHGWRRGQGQRAVGHLRDLRAGGHPGDPRSCRSPASLEARHGCRHVRGEGRHRTLKIEHLFDRIKSSDPAIDPVARARSAPPLPLHRPVTTDIYPRSHTMLTMPSPTAAPLPERPILVVDDDAKIVRLVRTYLERDGFAVVTAADGPAALDAIERHRPALVVLDLMLPGLDGRAVIRAVRGDDAAAATPILIVSARGSTLDRIAGLEDGADDYLPKPFSPAELVLRVKSILRRSAPAATDTTSRPPLTLADLTIDLGRYEVSRAGRPIPLTRVEFRLLTSLIEAGGRVLTRDQLLDAVYGQDGADVLDRTVDVHIGRLRDKLGDDADDPRYVATVRGVGYRAAGR
jgi:DNA-binding response OmpR family regulator